MTQGPIDRSVECGESFDQFRGEGGRCDPFADGDGNGRASRDTGMTMDG